MNKTLVLLLVVCLAAFAPSRTAGTELDDESYELNYICAQGTGILPQGSSRVRGGAGALLTAGRYVEGFLAVEASLGASGGNAALAVRGLWHWWGYEKFDPFFTFGAQGWFGGDAGPCAGWGTFWHFNDNWSLRVETNAMLGACARECAMAYTLSAGIQYSF